MRRWLHWLNNHAVLTTLLVSGILLALLVVINRLPLWHTDLWAHLQFGSWIRKHQAFPQQEPFLACSDQATYVPFAWLSQVLMSWIYEAGSKLPFRWSNYDAAQPGGVDALRFVHALLVTFRFLFLYLAFLRWSKSRLASWLALLFCLSLSWGSLEVLRPQVWGELCFAIMLFLVCRQPPGRWGTWMVPVLMVLWANLHGSYLSGLLVLLGVLFSRMLIAIKACQDGAGGNAFHSTSVRRTFRMFTFCLLAVGFLNPMMSFRWYTETLHFARNANVRMMDEWQPLNWSSPQGMTFAMSLAVVVITQLLTRWQRVAGITIGHGLLLLCFGVQVVLFQRMLPWWAMLCPLVCVGPWSRLINAPSEVLPLGWPIRLMQAVVIIVGCWIGVAWSSVGQVLIRESITPLETSLHPGTPRVMARAGLTRLPAGVPPAFAAVVQKPGACVFCSETLGDYLLFAGFRSILLYSHVQFFTHEHWQKCLQVKRGEPNWEQQLNQWNVRSVCVEAELHPALCEQIRRSPNWVVILDEAGSSSKPNPVSRLFIAARK